MLDPTLVAAGVNAATTLGSQLLGGGNNHAGRDARQAMSYANQAAVLDKVAAAKKAGISPLYALGAPVIGGGWSRVGDTGMADTVRSMGGDISRAIAATSTEPERQLQALQLERAGLENDLLRSQIANSKSALLASNPTPPAAGLIPERLQSPQRTVGANLWTGFESNPYVSDLGQIIEDRYGDDNPITWPIGAAVLASDVYWNSTLRKAINEIASSKMDGKSAIQQILGY